MTTYQQRGQIKKTNLEDELNYIHTLVQAHTVKRRWGLELSKDFSSNDPCVTFHPKCKEHKFECSGE